MNVVSFKVQLRCNDQNDEVRRFNMSRTEAREVMHCIHAVAQ